MTCGIMHPDDFGAPEDRSGCHLPLNHSGPHEYVATNGRAYQWETDLACGCEGCREVERYGDGDYCTTYWEKDRAPDQGAAALTNPQGENK